MLLYTTSRAKESFIAGEGVKIYNPNVIVGNNVKLYHNVIIFGDGPVFIDDDTKIEYNGKVMDFYSVING